MTREQMESFIINATIEQLRNNPAALGAFVRGIHSGTIPVLSELYDAELREEYHHQKAQFDRYIKARR